MKEFENENNLRFDYVMRFRTDTILFKKLNLDIFNFSKENLHRKCIEFIEKVEFVEIIQTRNEYLGYGRFKKVKKEILKILKLPDDVLNIFI